ncbi:MAG: fructosamine kinase family protein, partial [Proteiniphilum sp.]|nr:fructosamine kinase family protein [Proteiniphilum sp.]
TIAVPHVHLVDSFEGTSFLLMEFIESKRADGSDYRRLGAALAQLHQCTQADYGFSADNFIGSLPQSNQAHSKWADFYWTERILPQLQRAVRDGMLSKKEIPAEDKAIPLFNNLFGDVKPSLLHGDLWGGNYLIATDGTPYLIDPALYYGHSMVDISMSRLFGGFGAEFYNAYHEIIPQPVSYTEQIELYQLYYLLVHLNLFGSGYYSSVLSILKRYF